MRRNDAQLGLALDEQPKRWRESVLVSFHTRKQPMPVEEALAGEKRAGRQERAVLAWFRQQQPGSRFTPRDVWAAMGGDKKMLLNSTRRALSNLANERRWALGPLPLVHHPKDRRPGPVRAKESCWSLSAASFQVTK